MTATALTGKVKRMPEWARKAMSTVLTATLIGTFAWVWHINTQVAINTTQIDNNAKAQHETNSMVRDIHNHLLNKGNK